jgi:hypothetical protein
LETASRLKQRCSAVFNYAITKLLTTSNPVLPLRGSFQAPKNKNHARLKIEEMREFMQKLAAYDGRKQTALAIRLLAYAFCELVFPGDRVPSKPMSENITLFALYRIGYRSKMTGHGFRGIASTALNEMGYRPDVIERQLTHTERDGVRRL